MLSFFDPHDETGWKQPRVIEMGAFEGRGFLEGDGAFAVNVNSIQGGGGNRRVFIPSGPVSGVPFL